MLELPSSAMSSRRRQTLVSMTLAASAILSGCTLLLSPLDADQCESPEDCAALGEEYECSVDQVCVPRQAMLDSSEGTDSMDDPTEDTSEPVWESQWACLGKVPLPMPKTGQTHIFRQAFESLETPGRPPNNMKVRLCAQFDVPCDLPLYTDILVQDGGIVEITVDSGFEGYFEVTGDGVLPTISPLGSMVVSDRTTITRPIVLLSEASYRAALYNLAEPDFVNRAQMNVGLRDCYTERAEGITVSISPMDPTEMMQVFYVRNLLPVPNDTQPWSDRTAGSTVANVPVGVSLMETYLTDPAILEEFGFPPDKPQRIGGSSWVARAGWVTSGFVPPTP